MNTQQLLVGRREAAAALSISLRKLEGMIAEKEIKVRRIGRRVLVSRVELERFAGEGEAGATA